LISQFPSKGTRDEMKCQVNSPQYFPRVDPEKTLTLAFDFDTSFAAYHLRHWAAPTFVMSWSMA
jgi:hypothetical protein